MRWGGHLKGFFLAGLLAVFPATGFIPAGQSAEPASEYSCDELWRERNAIYAEQGYCFKSAKAIAEFGRGCFPPYGKLERWQRSALPRLNIGSIAKVAFNREQARVTRIAVSVTPV